MAYGKESALSEWTAMDGQRQQILRRAEEHAALTIPKLFPLDHKTTQDSANQDYQSFGAQCVNHLSTKLMLTLFAPSRPFIRLEAGDELIAEMLDAGIDPELLPAMFAQGEMKAVKQLDVLALRPKLFELLKHLIVIGNVVAVMDEKKKSVRVMTLRNFVVKRNIEGKVQLAIIRERVKYDELTDEVKANMPEVLKSFGKHSEQTEVDFLIRICKVGDKYETTQWVNEHQLPEQFTGSYPEAKLPYRVLTWDLADKDDYGTGLVEDYRGDLSALSQISEALLNAALLASEFRWLANPGGMTRPEDFNNSHNGECLPGAEGDLVLVQAGREVASAMQVQQSTIQEYISRIGRGFLLATSVTRNAERVTAEEIRMQAAELETGLGGGYSRLAVDVQKPLGYFLLAVSGFKIEGSDITPVVITGLDALSRNGDLENLKLFLSDVGQLGLLPPEVLAKLKIDAIVLDLGTGRGIMASKYVKSEAEVAQDRATSAGNEIATAGGVAQAEAAAQPQGA